MAVTVGLNRPTPKLTDHARQRCIEMGLTTRRVKRVVQEPDLAYDSHGRRMMCRFDEPTFRVVVDADGLVITVLPWTYETYERAS